MIDQQTLEILREISKSLAALHESLQESNAKLISALSELKLRVDSIEKLVSDNK